MFCDGGVCAMWVCVRECGEFGAMYPLLLFHALAGIVNISLPSPLIHHVDKNTYPTPCRSCPSCHYFDILNCHLKARLQSSRLIGQESNTLGEQHPYLGRTRHRLSYRPRCTPSDAHPAYPTSTQPPPAHHLGNRVELSGVTPCVGLVDWVQWGQLAP